MNRTARWITLGLIALFAAAPVAYGRGGGGGRGGGMGGGGGGRGGGMGGGMGGGGRMGGGMGGRMGGGMGGRMGAGRFFGGPGGGGGSQSDQELKEMEDRKNLITERRSRLGDLDRAVNQEARLAAARLAAFDGRADDDVR